MSDVQSGLPEELEFALRRINYVAARGDYREARDRLRVLRMTHAEYKDVLDGMDDLFFEAEAERNRRLFPLQSHSLLTPGSGFLATLGACLCLVSFFTFRGIWPEWRAEGIHGTTTEYRGKVNRYAVEVPISQYVQWAAVWGVAGVLILGGAYQVYQRGE